jgi:DnaK suppressor protein
MYYTFIYLPLSALNKQPEILHLGACKTGAHLARVRRMTHSRHAELKEMLEGRRQGIQEDVRQKLRAFRDMVHAETTRPPADLSDDPAQDDLDFALVEMQSQTLENITATLARLHAGDYGICHECEEEISEKRLRALPFATRCLTCQDSAEHIQFRDRHFAQRRPTFAAVQ